jgi:FixJ family two-component response regulator
MAFLDRVRKSPDSRNPYVPVIVVTAYSEYAYVIQARDRGMTDFLAKPLTAKMIYERIRSVIDNARPFVQADSFFGPDRRRRRLERQEPDRRGA